MRCVDCAHFPWAQGADLFGTSTVRCHPDLPARRWTNEAAAAEQDCPLFQARDGQAAATQDEDLTIAEMKPLVAETTDMTALQEMLEHEKAREQPRVTALRLIEGRIKELEEAAAHGGTGETNNA